MKYTGIHKLQEYRIAARSGASVFMGLMMLMASLVYPAQAQRSDQNAAMLTQRMRKRIYRAGVLEKTVSVDLSHIKLEKALHTIAHRAGLKLVYSEHIVPGQKTITLHAKDQQLEHVLWQVLDGTGLRFAVSSHHHLVLLPAVSAKKPVPKAAKASPVTGTVTNAANGNALPGVNISIKGTTQGTSSNANGKFRLRVPSLQDTLVFSFIGFKTKSVPINGRSELTVVMKSQAIEGQEMVVVGYGSQKKQNVTGAISSVNSTDIQDQPVSNLQDALQGKAAGIRITQNSGQPGSTANVQIRGLTSINSSNPLYVVDGTPLASNDINSIDPSNIASIQVLKDASAEAIYGSRGANGVVLIKTKQGSKNNSQISVNAYGGIQQVAKKFDLLHSANFVKLNNEGYRNGGAEPKFTKDPSAYTTDTRWQDLLYRPAPIQNYNVAFSGGSEDLTYRASGGYLNQQGIITGSNYDRISFRLNTTFDPRKDVEFGENLTVKKSKQHGVLEGTTYDNVVIAAIQMDPTVPVKTDGTYSAPRYSDTRNPLARTNVLTPANPTSNWDVVGNTYVQYDPIKGLTLKSNLSIDLNFYDNPNFTPSYNFAPNFSNPNPTLTHEKLQRFNWTWANTATYETDLNANNHIKILAGISQEKYTTDYVQGSNQGQPGNASYLRYLNAGINNPQVAGEQDQWALLSYFGRLNYNFNQTYFLTGSVRRDGSSKFGPGEKYGVFPAFSAGWVLTKEPFIHSGNVLSYLKLRGSWGITGNQQSLGYYDYSSSIQNYYYPFGPGSSASTAVTAEPGGLPNDNLHWEQVNQWNVGFDYRLINDRLTGSVDYYKKTTKDMLLSLPILATSGFTTGPSQNVASMANSGVEFSVDYQQNFGKNLNLDIGGHFSTLHNKVLSLKKEGERIFSGGNKAGNAELTEAGHRVASFYGYVANGVFQNWDQVYNHAYQSQQLKDGVSNFSGKSDYATNKRDQQTSEGSTAPGDIKFKDLNSDGVIDSKDRKFLGTPIPKVNYGFHLGGHWKGLDWNLAFSGVWGNKIFAAYKFYTDGFYLNNYNMSAQVLNRWHGEGTSNSIPRLTTNDVNGNSKASSFYLEDGAYLRLQNVTIGYTLPQQVLQSANIQKVRFYVSAQNLLTFTKYDGLNPDIGTEFGGGGGTLDYGVDPGTYPLARTVTAGINLSF